MQSEALNTVHNNMNLLSERLGQAGTELTGINKREKVAQYITMCLCFTICILLLFIIMAWAKHGLPASPPDSLAAESPLATPAGASASTAPTPTGAAAAPNKTLTIF